MINVYGLNPSESLMIGNDPKADMEGGQNAGMDTCYIHSNLSPELDEPVNSTFRVIEGDLKKGLKIDCFVGVELP